MRITINGKTIDACNINISSSRMFNGAIESKFSFETGSSCLFTNNKFSLNIFNGNAKISGNAIFESCNAHNDPAQGFIYLYSGFFYDYIQEEITPNEPYIIIRELKTYDINQVLAIN